MARMPGHTVVWLRKDQLILQQYFDDFFTSMRCSSSQGYMIDLDSIKEHNLAIINVPLNFKCLYNLENLKFFVLIYKLHMQVMKQKLHHSTLDIN